MKRNLSAGFVTIAGLLFAAAGAYAMWTGWDMILLERGWSLFIAGSVILSSGLVTVALGRVISLLARIASQPAAVSSDRLPAPLVAPVMAASDPATVKPEAPARAEPAPVSAPETPRLATTPKPSAFRKPAPARPRAADEETFAEKMSAVFEAARERPVEAPKEVDRYEAGGALYIMLSDGSVEVHGPNGVQHYPTIAALKAEAGLQTP